MTVSQASKYLKTPLIALVGSGNLGDYVI